MTREISNLFAVQKNAGGTFDVVNQTKEFQSIGPDIGRVVRSHIVAKVETREQANTVLAMLNREHNGELFSIAATVTRRVQMIAIDNPSFAESVSNPTTY